MYQKRHRTVAPRVTKRPKRTLEWSRVPLAENGWPHTPNTGEWKSVPKDGDSTGFMAECPNYLFCQQRHPRAFLEDNDGRCYFCNLVLGMNLVFEADELQSCSLCLEETVTLMEFPGCPQSHRMCVDCARHPFIEMFTTPLTQSNPATDAKDTFHAKSDACPLCNTQHHRESSNADMRSSQNTLNKIEPCSVCHVIHCRSSLSLCKGTHCKHSFVCSKCYNECRDCGSVTCNDTCTNLCNNCRAIICDECSGCCNECGCKLCFFCVNVDMCNDCLSSQ